MYHIENTAFLGLIVAYGFVNNQHEDDFVVLLGALEKKWYSLGILAKVFMTSHHLFL